jgi:chemotaxis protein methyltransferase CheR
MSLSAQEFAFVSSLVRREAAIVLEPGKEYLVEARLLSLAREAGAATVAEFVARAQQRPSSETNARIVDAMTTNETSWFRDREPFTALSDLVLPAVLPQRSNRVLRVWSAACSSGQEPYTIAMTLQDALPAGWTFEITATDLSAEMIARAEEGRFSQLEMNRGLPATHLVRHFERAGTGWQVSADLRRRITFKRLNLAAALPPMQPFDVVFLRNVLIYFDVETKRTVLGRIRAMMRPDSWLFLGSAETTLGIRDDFERVPAGRTSAYRLRAPGAPGAPARPLIPAPASAPTVPARAASPSVPPRPGGHIPAQAGSRFQGVSRP